jgi:hypothetical protein
MTQKSLTVRAKMIYNYSYDGEVKCTACNSGELIVGFSHMRSRTNEFLFHAFREWSGKVTRSDHCENLSFTSREENAFIAFANVVSFWRDDNR